LLLFDMNQQERKRLNRFLRWHCVYLTLVAIFFSIIYMTDIFRTNFILSEKFIFLFLAPLCTIIFVILSPWRQLWHGALKNMYLRLEGQAIFCALAGFVFVFGFFSYSIFIWGLGALGPSLVYM
jgi:hypothetical protein